MNNASFCYLKLFFCFEHYLMDHLSIEEVRMLFRRLDARVPLTRPMICHYYNTQNGCNKDDSCSALHICKYFFTGCKFEDKCRRNHDVSVNKVSKSFWDILSSEIYSFLRYVAFWDFLSSDIFCLLRYKCFLNFIAFSFRDILSPEIFCL